MPQKKRRTLGTFSYFLAIFFVIAVSILFSRTVYAFIVTPNVYFSNPLKNVTLSFNSPINFSVINVTPQFFAFDNYTLELTASGKTIMVFYNLSPLYRRWTENYSSLGIVVNHTFNLFPPNASIVLMKDGAYFETLKSNGFGYLTFITNSTENLSEYTLLIDKTPPIITGLSFSKYVPWLHYQIIECNATDNIKVNTTEILIDGSIVAKCFSRSCEYTRKETVAKTHYVECLAIDSSGNTASKEGEYVVYYPSGGSSTSQPTVPVHEATFYLINIPANKKVVFNVSNRAIPLKEISIVPKEEIKNAKIIVKLNKENPTNAKLSKAYSFFTINHTDLNESELKSITMVFEVNKSWLSTTTASANDVFLLRYENDQWAKMPTQLLEESAKTYIYKATVPGLSYYAIALIIPQKQLPLPKEENKSTNLPPKPKLPETQVANKCKENAKRCVGNEIEICKNGHWQILKICKYGCNQKTLECLTPRAPNQSRSNNKNKVVVAAILILIVVLILIYIFYISRSKEKSRVTKKKNKRNKNKRSK